MSVQQTLPSFSYQVDKYTPASYHGKNSSCPDPWHSQYRPQVCHRALNTLDLQRKKAFTSKELASNKTALFYSVIKCIVICGVTSVVFVLLNILNIFINHFHDVFKIHLNRHKWLKLVVSSTDKCIMLNWQKKKLHT